MGAERPKGGSGKRQSTQLRVAALDSGPLFDSTLDTGPQPGPRYEVGPAAAQAMTDMGMGWWAHDDPTSGKTYYAKGSEVSWELPAEL